MDTKLAKWETTGLLTVFKDNKKYNALLCLESQVDFNGEADHNRDFNRISIPVLVRALSTSQVFSRNSFVKAESDHTAEAHIFNVKYKPPVTDMTDMTIEQQNKFLQKEANYVAEFSKSIREELDSLFKDQYDKNIYFHGIGSNTEGTVYLYYNL